MNLTYREIKEIKARLDKVTGALRRVELPTHHLMEAEQLMERALKYIENEVQWDSRGNPSPGTADKKQLGDAMILWIKATARLRDAD